MRIPFWFHLALILSLIPAPEIRAEAGDEDPKLPLVTLLADGGAPKSRLRFQIEAGDEQKWWNERTTIMEMEIIDLEGKYTNYTPKQIITRPIVLTAEQLEIIGTAGTGVITGDSRLVDFHVTPGGGQVTYSLSGEGDTTDMVAENTKALGELMHRKFRFTIDSRGAPTEQPDAAGSNIQLQTGTEVDSMLPAAEVVFPEEPVGPGARWTVRRSISEIGIELEVTTTFELVSISEGAIRLKFEIEGSAPPAITTQAGEPEGWYMEHTVIKLIGTGESVYDPGKLKPVDAKISLTMKREMIRHMVERRALMKIDASIRFKQYDEPLTEPEGEGQEQERAPSAPASAPAPGTAP